MSETTNCPVCGTRCTVEGKNGSTQFCAPVVDKAVLVGEMPEWVRTEIALARGWVDNRAAALDEKALVWLADALDKAERERDEDDRIRSRMFSLLLAIKHDAEWHDLQSRTPRVQFSAYHAEADALLSELISPSVGESASKMMAQMALASHPVPEGK